MVQTYSFLDEEKTSESTKIDPRVQAKINLGIYVIWGFAALFLIFDFFVVGHWIEHDALGFAVIMGLLLLAVVILSVVSGILLKKGDYYTAWILLKIAGILSLPVGLILLIAGALAKNLFKNIEDQEFQQMLNKTEK